MPGFVRCELCREILFDCPICDERRFKNYQLYEGKHGILFWKCDILEPHYHVECRICKTEWTVPEFEVELVPDAQELPKA